MFIYKTEIEFAANKYTFVWKKATAKNQQKLMEKVLAFVLQMQRDFGKLVHGQIRKLHHLLQYEMTITEFFNRIKKLPASYPEDY